MGIVLVPCAMLALGLRRGRVVVGIILAIVLLASCGAGVPLGGAAPRPADSDLMDERCWGEQVAASARWHLEHRQTTGRRDCSGLIEAILARAGAPVRGSSRSFWMEAARSGRIAEDPRPGDLVFFDRTYDANKNGRVDDELTHIAVVMEVDCEGTVHMVHRGSGKTKPLRMNLEAPSDRRRNDFLRARKYGRKRGPRLAGELFRDLARPPR